LSASATAVALPKCEMTCSVSMPPNLSRLQFEVKQAEKESLYHAYMQKVGERMKTIRTRRGLKLEEVAKVMGISASALSQIENGVTDKPTLEPFLKFCEYFREDPYYVAFEKPSALMSDVRRGRFGS
jgi:DNA-binding XRE family transcriptional regulator